MTQTRSWSKYLAGAWLWLVGFSLAAALMAAAMANGLPRPAAGAAILVLALLKARVILARYLGLVSAPPWLSGFTWVIGLWALLMLGLYLVPALLA
jgi:nitric oxide reductase NorF protein